MDVKLTEAIETRETDLNVRLKELSMAVDRLTKENLCLTRQNRESLDALVALAELYDQVISKLIHDKAVADAIVKAIKRDYV